VAPQPPAIDDVKTIPPARDHLADHFGRVLQIGVHDDDGFARGGVHAGADRDLMAEISRRADIAVARIGLGLVAQDDRTAIGRGIVDENRFRRTVQPVHQYVEAAQQHRQHRFLVKNGNHDAVANVAGVGRHRTITQPNGATLVHEWLRSPCGRAADREAAPLHRGRISTFR
jgi:hypothetical protein